MDSTSDSSPKRPVSPFFLNTFVATGNLVEGKIVNKSNESGRVLFWVEANGVRLCPRTYSLEGSEGNNAVYLRWRCLG